MSFNLLSHASKILGSVGVVPLKSQPFSNMFVILPPEHCEIQPAKDTNQTLPTAGIRRIGMVDLALFANGLVSAPSSANKTAMPRLLARQRPRGIFLHLLLVLEIIPERCLGLVLSGLEVVVEVGAVRADPGEVPAHVLLVRGDLGDRGTGDSDEGGGACVQVLQGRNMVGEEGA